MPGPGAGGAGPRGQRRPLLLASVRSAAEARLAVAGGADLVDAKEPASGALGAVDADVVSAIRAVVPAPIPVSATIGDVPCTALDEIAARAAGMSAAGADIVKIGLFMPGEATAMFDRLAHVREGHGRRFLVMLADRGIDLALLAELPRAGFAGVMLDTADKSSGALADICDDAQLAGFVFTARQAGLRVGLAGALRLWHIPRMMRLGADILGFRGALCRAGARAGEIDRTAVEDVAQVLRAGADPATARESGDC